MVAGDSYQILKEFLRITSPFIRDKFLDQSVQSLARMLGADFAFVARALSVPATGVRVLAAWENGKSKESWDFDLSGTPCSVIYEEQISPAQAFVVRRDGIVVIPKNLWSSFPATRETQFQGFIGIPLWSHDESMLGHVAVFFNDRLTDDAATERTIDILQIFAHRIEAELERMRLEDEISVAYAELRQANLRLMQDSITDALTQVANRRYFNQRCREAHARQRRSGGTYALLLIDIDHFKSVNDSHGHEAGDRVLQAVANALRQGIREDVEVVARIGGEEFCVICHATDEQTSTMALAERLRASIADLSIAVDGHAVSTSISIGVATCNTGDAMWEDVFRRADRALYEAKSLGRNRICAEKICGSA